MDTLRAGPTIVEVMNPDYVEAQREVNIDRLLSPGDFKLQPK